MLDSTTVQKKTFQELRKEQNEFRNLKMHMVCVALRLQDLNPKIRSKMSLILSRVSLDDYQLKIRNLLRNSEFRDIITELPKGEFIFPELDLKLTTEPFKQEGTPYEIKPKLPEKPKRKAGFWKTLLALPIAILTAGSSQQEQPQQADKELEELSNEDSQLDLYETTDKEGDEIFPEEEF